jgi:hypothetical protein
MNKLSEDLRLDAEMMRDGHHENLTELWHSDVVKDAAKDCDQAADAIDEAIEALEAARKCLCPHAYEEDAAALAKVDAALTKLRGSEGE